MFVGSAKYSVGNEWIHFTNKEDHDAAQLDQAVKETAELEAATTIERELQRLNVILQEIADTLYSLKTGLVGR